MFSIYIWHNHRVFMHVIDHTVAGDIYSDNLVGRIIKYQMSKIKLRPFLVEDM